MDTRYFLLLVFFSLTSFTQLHASSAFIKIEREEFAVRKNEIISLLPAQLLVADVIWSVDVPMDHQELSLLTGIVKKKICTADHILYALKLIFAKDSIKEILFSWNGGPKGFILSFTLTSIYTLDCLKVTGVSMGKEFYRQAYGIQLGQCFDEERHQRALAKLKENCRQEGYLDLAIEPKVIYDHHRKKVHVHLHITGHRKYAISGVLFRVKLDNDVAHDEAVVQRLLKIKFARQLKKKFYEQARVNRFIADINTYLQKKGYLHVDVSLSKDIDVVRKEVFLRFNLHLSPRWTCTFLGNKFLNVQELQEIIWKFGRSAWLLPLSILAAEIERVYRERGFWQVRVDAKEEGGRSVFYIHEGIHVRVEQIYFQGITTFVSSEIEKMFFKNLLQTDFNELIFKKSIENLLKYYHDAGFFDVRIVDSIFDSSLNDGRYKLLIQVAEGQRTMINRVAIPSHQEIVQEPIFSTLFAQEEEIVLTPDLLEKQRMWLSEYFRNRGYRAVSLEYHIQKESCGNTLVWQVRGADKPSFFGKTVLCGAPFCSHDVLFKYLAYKEGDIWNVEKLHQSFVRLKQLGIFESVRLAPAYDLIQDSKIPILLSVHEDEEHELRLRFGAEMQHVQHYQTLAGLTYRVGGSFFWKNPFHICDQLRIDIDLTRSHREIVGLYSWPLLYIAPWTASTQLYSIKYDYPGFIGSNKTLYTLMQHGGLCAFEEKTMHFESNCSVGLECMKTSFSQHNPAYVKRLARALDFAPKFVGKTIPFLFVEPTYYIDFTDDKLDPSSGYSMLFSLKWMFPFVRHTKSSLFLLKNTFEATVFVPIRQAVLALRGRFGHIFHHHFSNIMPSERFYLGGAHSLRSYPPDLTPPFGIFVDDEGKRHSVPRGGKTMINFNAEVRFPLYHKIRAVIFQDLGFLTDNIKRVDREHFLFGTGFGVRYATPFGPLRFDVGFNWRRPFLDAGSYAWFLTFGQAF